MGTRSNLLLIAGLCCLSVSPAAAEDVSAVEDGATGTAAIAAIASGTIAGAQPSDLPSSADNHSGWQFSAAPYFWMSGLKGDMGVVEEVEPVAVDLSFFDILDALKFALMGTFDARNGRFVATADIFYLSMGTSKNVDIREVDFLDVELKSKTFISTLAAGYRAVDQGRLSLDVLAGGRITSMKTSLDLEGPQRSFSGSKTETWIDPVVAVRFQAPLGDRWTVRAYGDIGGFGVGSDLSWQLQGRVEYDLSSRWSLSAGWRHLDIDYHHNGFMFDAAMDGPIIGAAYRF